MANAIGYEQLTVTTVETSPALSALTGGVACAVFYVDPDARGVVHWRPDPTSPTGWLGFPLGAGKWISVAGEGNIRNSKFILSHDTANSIIVHVLYFDRVDVVAADFAADPTGAQIVDLKADLRAIRELTAKVLLELRRITLGTTILTKTDLVREIK